MVTLSKKNINQQYSVRPELVKGLPQRFLKQRQQAGVTLIELILSMVIISIALTGVFSVINLTVSHSADPVVEHQAIAIAEAYLEEIQLQSFTDPDGTNVGETSRARFDNVDDYNGLNDVGAHNQLGASITSLSSYNVTVAVVNQTVVGLAAKEITVSVSGPGVSGLTLVGYKFNQSL